MGRAGCGVSFGPKRYGPNLEDIGECFAISL